MKLDEAAPWAIAGGAVLLLLLQRGKPGRTRGDSRAQSSSAAFIRGVGSSCAFVTKGVDGPLVPCADVFDSVALRGVTKVTVDPTRGSQAAMSSLISGLEDAGFEVNVVG